jgi:hypothetical protein
MMPRLEEIIGLSGIIFLIQAVTLMLIQKRLSEIAMNQKEILSVIRNRENLEGVLSEIKDLHDKHKK